jgi:hypothetical protein
MDSASTPDELDTVQAMWTDVCACMAVSALSRRAAGVCAARGVDAGGDGGRAGAGETVPAGLPDAGPAAVDGLAGIDGLAGVDGMADTDATVDG